MVSLRWTALALLAAAARATVNVFVAGDSPSNKQYRIPALVATAKGTLLAFAEARTDPATDCGYKWIVSRRSVDGGMTWTTKDVDVAGRNWTDRASGNPQAVFDPATGRVVLVFGSTTLPAGGCSPGDSVFVVDDGGSDGVAWGAPRNISGDLGGSGAWGGIVPGPGAGIVTTVMKPGRIIFSGTSGAYVHDIAFYSDDHGLTWTTAAATLNRVDESTLVELPSGEIIINMRNPHNTNCSCRAYATSTDGGATFGQIQYDPVLIEPECEGALARIGDRVYFSNPASKSERETMTVRWSAPGGVGWVGSVIVAAGPTWGGYSSIAAQEVAPGFGGILFERNDTSAASPDVISFSRFPTAS